MYLKVLFGLTVRAPLRTGVLTLEAGELFSNCNGFGAPACAGGDPFAEMTLLRPSGYGGQVAQCKLTLGLSKRTGWMDS